MIKFLFLFLISFELLSNDFINFLNNTNSFKANFTQDAGGEITSGVFSFSKPKNFKWHTLKPQEKILMLSNGKITNYDIWLNTANIINYKHNELVEYLATSPDKLPEKPRLFSQENDINYYQLGKIIFGFKNKDLAEIITTNELDEQIYVKFNNIEKNIDLIDNFVINFPRDVDVLDETL